MAKTDFKSVNEYVTSKPKHVQVILKRVRSAIRKAVPAAEEVISYQIPAYKLRGATALYFAGWKQHFSIYPVTGLRITQIKDEPASFEVNKGTVRFPLSQPVPVKLIVRIAKLRANHVAGPAKVNTRRSASKKR